jgi:hypothetical protein
MTTESLKLMLERHRQVKVDHSSRRRVSQDGRIYYQQRYSPVFVSCLKSTDHADTSPFSFVAAIGKDGRVLRLYVDHETNIYACARLTLQKEEFPHPPLSPYYLHISMSFQ